MKSTLRVTVCLLSLFIVSTALAQPQDSMFDPPVIIRAGDEPLNKDGRIMYPSPVIFDVDSDGQNEMVLGSIFGGIYVCENSNQETGDPVWSKPVPLKTCNDKAIKLNNW